MDVDNDVYMPHKISMDLGVTVIQLGTLKRCLHDIN